MSTPSREQIGIEVSVKVTRHSIKNIIGKIPLEIRGMMGLVWVLAFLFTPFVITYFDWLPSGTEFIPRILLVFLLPLFVVRKAAFRAGMVVVVLGAFFSLFSPGSLRLIVDGLNHRMQDAFFTLRGPRKPSGQVVIVDIDDKSLRELGQWPWPRTQMAELVEVLKREGARCVGFDIVFAEPDRLSLVKWLDRLQQLGLSTFRPSTDGKWEVQASTIKNLLLDEWERRLHLEDSTWMPEPGLSAADRETQIVAKYLEEREADWQERNLTQVERAKRAGLPYQVQSYSVPADPILDMARHSQELSYLGRDLHPTGSDESSLAIQVSNDEVLAQSIHSPRVVLGGLFITPSSAGSRLSAYLRREARRESDGMVLSSGIVGASSVFPGIRQAVEQVLNVRELQDAALHQGSFNIVPDRSGAARFYTLMMQAPVYQESLVLKPELEGKEGIDLLNPDNYETKIISQMFTYPSLALEMLRVANGYEKAEPGFFEGQRGLWLKRGKGYDYAGLGLEPMDYSKEEFPNLLAPEHFIPLDFKADLLIDYHGYGGKWRPESEYPSDYYFDYYSLVDILHGEFPPGALKNKYVLVGSTDPTLSDLVGSPFRPAFPGLEVHAVVLDNLIAQRFLVDHGKWATLYQFLGILVAGTLVAAAVAFLNAWLAGITTMMVLIGLPGLSYLALADGGMVINFVYPWFISIALTIVIVIVNFFVEGRDRRFVVSQFSKMVSGDVLRKLRDDPRGVSLKGQKAQVSVMFSDIAQFTTVSEKLPPQELVQCLNDYLTPMTQIILQHDGFIDKFIGDAIMGCWGVPFSDDEHARKACFAAIEQQETLRRIRPEIEEAYRVSIYVRMGIASGEVSAALMGSEDRKSYTVMGDVVNLGSRLEPCCTDYGVQILICDMTYQLAKAFIEARCVDKLVVKGKTVPVPIYELMGKKGEVSPEKIGRARLFEKALKLHWERDWEKALRILNSLHVEQPEDEATTHLIQRIHRYQLDPPSDDWQGERVRLHK